MMIHELINYLLHNVCLGEVALQSLVLMNHHSLDYGDIVICALGNEAVVSHSKGQEDYQERKRIIHNDAAKVNAIRATSSVLVTAGTDMAVKVFDWEGIEQRVLSHHHSAVWGLDVDAKSSSMVASSGYCIASISDLRSPHAPPFSFRAAGTWVRTLHLDVDRHLLITGSCDASSKVWDLRNGETLTKLVHPNHFEEVRSVQCVDDSIFTGCYDGIVREYDLLTGRLKVGR